MEYTLKDIDKGTWARFKARCALLGISMKDMLIKLIEKEIARGGE